MIFQDRKEAGRLLAEKLGEYANRSDVLVLALPRGGVPVAFEVASALNVTLDIFLVRKLGVPGQRELAMGAIATGGIRVINDDVVDLLGISDDVIDTVAAEELSELERRERIYRGDRPATSLSGKTVILIDDGLATGSTMRAAVAAVRKQQPACIIVAVPVAPVSTLQQLEVEADEVICLATPENFRAVGGYYQSFLQTTDEEVCNLLRSSRDYSQVS